MCVVFVLRFACSHLLFESCLTFLFVSYSFVLSLFIYCSTFVYARMLFILLCSPPTHCFCFPSFLIFPVWFIRFISLLCLLHFIHFFVVLFIAFPLYVLIHFLPSFYSLLQFLYSFSIVSFLFVIPCYRLLCCL